MGRRAFIAALGGAALGALAACTSAAALETVKPEAAQKFLGPAFTGPNYTVKPLARSDGIMRIFDVETPYGQYQFDGAEFAKMRLQELKATATLEKVSHIA
jgi:copper oxidase (laccase) domain-containing protein